MDKNTLIAIIGTLAVALGISLYFIYSSPDKTGSAVVAPDNASIVYKNTDYGFTFSLPANWVGYSIVATTWKGFPLKETAAPSGPKLLIRNPKWTAAAPYEDLPILVFTTAEWKAYLAEDFSVSAAPIPASELAHNNTYVFALPPRWNFDASIGYEEAVNIIAKNPLHAFDL
ncbi:MAG: hypothetical protein WCO79_00960 [bacterium]